MANTKDKDKDKEKKPKKEKRQVSCKRKHKFEIPLGDTYAKCPVCGIDVVVYCFGTVGGEFY